eukprot:4594620-Amphidinium_carterae.1
MEWKFGDALHLLALLRLNNGSMRQTWTLMHRTGSHINCSIVGKGKLAEQGLGSLERSLWIHQSFTIGNAGTRRLLC